MRILLVEDNEVLGDGLAEALRDEGETVDWLTDGESALHALLSEAFDLLILDLGIPKRDGLSVLQQMRSKGKDLPVLILTARDQLEDKVKGLDIGADDYMVKPFDIAELLARIRALSRRFHGRTTPEIEIGHLYINPESRDVRFSGNAVKLSRREYALLFELASHQGKVLSKSHLADLIYGWGDEVESNALEVHIHNIRKKTRDDLIKTVRGVGYLLAC
ncbi:MAG: response regulator transcription factor [Hahellaceae bacterium]|nr:response regulator transcription factor [Hahellaceae bacterium]